MREPIQLCYGGGVDSTAMAILIATRREYRSLRPDAITMADVGAEKRATYEFIPIFDQWLRRHDMPGITMVRYQPRRAPYRTIEGNMVLNATLPGAAFGKHSCATKFKIEPQNKWTRRWALAQEAWAAGVKVRKLIGFEAGEEARLKRADAKAHSGKANKTDAKRYAYEMPLMEWGITREMAVEIIRDAGLPVPPKSACYFCPFQRPEEVDAATPEDRARTILIELAAEPYNKTVRGLWRRPRLEDGRPGSIAEYILARNLNFVPLESIAPVVVLNDKCKKARTGATFHLPHHGPTLRSLLEAAGHYAPPVITRDQWNGEGEIYHESLREVPAALENELHGDLIAAI